MHDDAGHAAPRLVVSSLSARPDCSVACFDPLLLIPVNSCCRILLTRERACQTFSLLAVASPHATNHAGIAYPSQYHSEVYEHVRALGVRRVQPCFIELRAHANFNEISVRLW